MPQAAGSQTAMQVSVRAAGELACRLGTLSGRFAPSRAPRTCSLAANQASLPRGDSRFPGTTCGTDTELTTGYLGLRGVGLRQAPGLPLYLPMPCRRLAVKDAEGAA